jgi:RNase P subunit RPR2
VEELGRKLDEVLHTILSLLPRCPRCSRPLVPTLEPLTDSWGRRSYRLVLTCQRCGLRLASGTLLSEVG